MQISDSITRLSIILDDCALTRAKREEVAQHLARIVQEHSKLLNEIQQLKPKDNDPNRKSNATT